MPKDRFVVGIPVNFDDASIGGNHRVEDGYVAGGLFLNGQSYSDGLYDLASRTHIELPPGEDSDEDGVIDDQDLCLGTLPGEAVNNEGCGIFQLVACALSADVSQGSRQWGWHMKYVGRMAQTAKEFYKDGLTSRGELRGIVRGAWNSECIYSPLSKISSIDFSFVWDSWDSDHEGDGVAIKIEYFNILGDTVHCKNKPVKVGIEFWTQNLLGEALVSVKNELVFYHTVIVDSSETIVSIPVEMYEAMLADNFPIFPGEPVQLFVVVRVSPLRGVPGGEGQPCTVI